MDSKAQGDRTFVRTSISTSCNSQRVRLSPWRSRSLRAALKAVPVVLCGDDQMVARPIHMGGELAHVVAWYV